MLRDTNAYGGGGLPERKTPQGMWSPDEEPHRTARTKARPAYREAIPDNAQRFAAAYQFAEA